MRLVTNNETTAPEVIDVDPRAQVLAEGFELLCVADDTCTGEMRRGDGGELRVTYGWHPDAAERVRRIQRGLAEARLARS